jgi:hypothetical protein
MNIRRFESHATYQAWGTGSGSPAFMILVCLVVNIVSLIVAIGINATASDEDDLRRYTLANRDAYLTSTKLISTHIVLAGF